ncbi:MAG: GntR family transcriptional regulator [Rhodobacteraceae bacterium]|nr:GntR family transcriptional regulator [Paracoccaceae bacterium]
MVEFSAVKVERVSDSIVNQIEKMILDGSLKPGEKLPPERALAEQLDVSRPSLREALMILESRGLLQSRRGGGTFVCDIIGPTIIEPLVHLMKSHPETIFDVLELRQALAAVAAVHAAERATDSDKEKIKQRFDELIAVFESGDTNSSTEAEAHTEFHLAIVEASHNVALVHIMRGLFNLLRVSIKHNLESIQEEPESHDIIRARHLDIYTAIMNSDPEMAREASNRHLIYIQKTMRQHQK